MRFRTHPGEILLEEFLKPMDITPHALAIALGVPATSIADTAAQLSRYFGTTPDFWLNLQSAYDISVAEQDKATKLFRMPVINLPGIPRTAGGFFASGLLPQIKSVQFRPVSGDLPFFITVNDYRGIRHNPFPHLLTTDAERPADFRHAPQHHWDIIDGHRNHRPLPYFWRFIPCS